MKCSKCGNTLSIGDRFCIRCGEGVSIKNAATAAATPDVYEKSTLYHPEKYNSKEYNKQGKLSVTLGLIALILFLIGLKVIPFRTAGFVCALIALFVGFRSFHKPGKRNVYGILISLVVLLSVATIFFIDSVTKEPIFIEGTWVNKNGPTFVFQDSDVFTWYESSADLTDNYQAGEYYLYHVAEENVTDFLLTLNIRKAKMQGVLMNEAVVDAKQVPFQIKLSKNKKEMILTNTETKEMISLHKIK